MQAPPTPARTVDRTRSASPYFEHDGPATVSPWRSAPAGQPSGDPPHQNGWTRDKGMSEDHLIDRAKRGEADACRVLYQRYAPRVYAVVRRMAGNDALAQDWAQEAWIRAFRALPRFRGDAAFSTWLHRVAVNSALQGKRSRKRHTTREAPLTESLAASPSPDRPVLRMRLERAIQHLPDGMRQVLVLHDVEGFTHEEIGEMLGVAAGTSKSQLFKARAKMRQMLRPEAEVASGGSTG